MKRTLMIGLLLASVSAFAFPGPRDDMRVLYDTLDLTKAQKVQLKTIRKETRDARLKLMDQMDDLREQSQERVMAVLTDEQRKTLLAKRAEMRQKRAATRCDHDRIPKPQMRTGNGQDSIDRR